MSDGPVVTFLGATGTVTGSRFLVEADGARVLVDCGLYQGAKELRLRNWAPFPVDPATLDAVVLTHAHLDHTGYLPALVRDGFRGPVHCTASTAALATIVMTDSGHLQEEDADYANRMRYSKHHPAKPLYTEEDAIRAAGHLRAVELGVEVEVAPGVRALWRRAGHILGSASVRLRFDDDRAVVFSGDLGRDSHPLLAPPAPPADAEVIVCESTYGARVHEQEGVVLERFRDAIVRTAARGGTVVIPAFAVDRTEIVLHHLAHMMRAGEVPELQVAVDSPMALASLDVYREAIARRDPDLREDVLGDPDPFDTGRLVEVRDREGSAALDRGTVPSIIVSASGMATGGRVLHHLARYLPDPRATVLIAGFQASGTRGRQLQSGARVVKLLGRYVGVKAEVVDLSALSVHADRDELLTWLGRADGLETVLVVHGEPEGSAALRDATLDRLGCTAAVPVFGERVRLG